MKSTYELALQAQVLFVKADGVTTMRDITDYVREFRQLVRPIIEKPWACVLDMRSWQPSPADQFEALRDNTRWCMHHNLTVAVVLLPADPLLAWQYIQTTTVEKRDDFRSFKAQDDGEVLAILQREGFPLQQATPFNRVAG